MERVRDLPDRSMNLDLSVKGALEAENLILTLARKAKVHRA
jgi:hypothetical protein